jgi:hypothetical protein
MWCNDSQGKTDRLKSVFGKRFNLVGVAFSGPDRDKGWPEKCLEFSIELAGILPLLDIT